MSNPDYSQMTDAEFDTILEGIVKEQTSILHIPGVYEVLREHFNNEVLEKWEADNPEKAHPPRLVQCWKCHTWINLNGGEDSQAERVNAKGTKDDPRSPGDHDNICDYWR